MRVDRVLFLTPRVLGLLFVAFLSIFALDVFGEGYGFWGTIFALAMHLIPALIILVVVAIAWRWEAAGGILLVVLGIGYLVSTWGHFHWVTYLLISGPPIFAGLLFLFSWARQAKSHQNLRPSI